MFTVDQLKAAHSRVKSGADFPAYIQDIKKLGVTFYETFVTDGHTDYYGTHDHRVTKPGGNEVRGVAWKCDAEHFKAELKEHQQGKTDYLTFIGIAARLGVYKWAVYLDKMTCTYYDRADREILVENIPH